MYSTCFHCQHALGRNEVVEHLPIGRRLAWDAAASRVWVICQHCSRWNLVPFESRWEAIEEAERTFRATPLRASTDNVGLAKTSEGSELVRIGKPQQQELATWRYGRHFAKRRWNYLTTTAPMTAAFFLATQASTHWNTITLGAGMYMPSVWQFGGIMAFSGLLGEARARWHTYRTQAMLAVGPDVTPVSRGLLYNVIATPGADGALQLWVPVVTARIEDSPPFVESLRAVTSFLQRRRRLSGHRAMRPTHYTAVSGDEASTALRTLLPVMNEAGASPRALDDSLAYLQRHHHDPAHIAFGGKRSWELASSTPLREFHHERRLALEMAVHADSERRWLDGEMTALLDEWRRADEIATIADGLLQDPALEAKLAALRAGRSGEDDAAG